jgi:threonine dehydrogenase-like Zn-dependent dehydrogenase
MSDVYLMTGKMPNVKFPTERFGHEPAGIVRAVGKEITRFQPGDRVTTLWARDGFMQYADYYCQDEAYTFHLPSDIPFAYGLCEPLAAAARGICGCGILPGDTVAVVGVGFFGLLMTQMASFLGAWKVAAFDKSPYRLELAKELGADVSYNVAEDGIARGVREVTGGRGFDLVIECAGTAGVFDACVDLVRWAGSVYAYAWHTKPETINPCNWHNKMFTLRSNSWIVPFGFDHERFLHMCDTSLRWLQRGLLRMDKLVKGITAREDLAAAIEKLTKTPGDPIKVVIGPKAGPVE